MKHSPLVVVYTHSTYIYTCTGVLSYDSDSLEYV